MTELAVLSAVLGVTPDKAVLGVTQVLGEWPGSCQHPPGGPGAVLSSLTPTR